MGIIAKPYTFSAGAVIIAAEHNAVFDTIYTEFNGNIDNANIKAGAGIVGSKMASGTITAGLLAGGAVSNAALDYASITLLRTGTTGLKVARGELAFTMPGASSHSITITFSGAIDGNPNFGSAPVLVGTIFIIDATAVAYRWRINAKSNTSAVIKIDSSDATDARAGTFNWFAIGS